MIVTLYKGCKLNNSYQEVFDCKTPDNVGYTALENYLNSLSFYTIELRQTYMTNRGKINVELEYGNFWNDVYKYNYIKFVDDDLIRYCFIDNIEIKNGLAIIYYSEDIWHSYSGSMKITNGHLINGNSKQYMASEYRKLPLEYRTNDELLTENLYLTTNEEPAFYLFATCQQYTLSQGGEPSTRKCIPVILAYANAETPNEFEPMVTLGSQIIKAVSLIASEQYQPINNVYYEFDNFTIVQREMINISNLNLQYALNSKKYDLDNYTKVRFNIVNDEFSSEGTTVEIPFEQRAVYNDYKNVGVGSFRSNIPTENNGTTMYVGGSLYVTPNDYKMILSANGQIIDITKDFTLEVPYSSINGETYAQRKIARNTETTLLETKNATNIARSAIGIGTNLGKMPLQFIEGEGSSAIGSIGSIGNEIVNIVESVQVTETKLAEINAEKYQNTYGTFISGEQGGFAFKGIVLKKIQSDNDYEVEKAIEYMGYQINEFVTDNVFKPKLNVDAIRFSTLNLYGDFPMSVNNKLMEILKSGVRIFYV